MRMDPLRTASGTGRLTRCAHPHSVHTLRVDVPVDDHSIRFVPTRSLLFNQQRGRTVENTHGRTHDAPGIGGIMPVINQDQIRFVLDKLTLRGPIWAREFMDRVEGFDRWPEHVQAAVQVTERDADE